MGWQEQQAAARAAEQQRQANQRAASARQAESIRQENETINRQQRERSNAEMFAANAQRDRERQARERAACDKAHADRMAELRRAGQNATPFTSSSKHSYVETKSQVYPSGGNEKTKKKGGGGLFFVMLVIGVLYVIGRSKQSGSNSSSSDKDPAPTVATRSTGAVGDSTGTTTAPATVTTLAAPSSNDLEPIDRPDAAYPETALDTRPTGPVFVIVNVQTNGVVSSVTPESGDPLLMPAAVEAAMRWTFKPYPYEQGARMRTMRIQFPFTPPALTELPTNDTPAPQ